MLKKPPIIHFEIILPNGILGLGYKNVLHLSRNQSWKYRELEILSSRWFSDMIHILK